MPYIGTSPSNGVRRVHTYTATASQTTFTGASSEGITLSYVDTNYIDVFQNGVLLGNADYTSTSGTSVVLAQGASADDLIVIVVYDVFSVADTVSKTNGGSFDSAVTMSNNLTVSGAFTSQGIDDNADATAITIDSSENVFVTKTSSDVAVVGQELRSSGFFASTRNGATVSALTRLSSDGTILEFRKDSSARGVIGCNSAYIGIGVQDCGVYFSYGDDAIIPANPDSAFSNRDDAIDLGHPSVRFDDIYATNGTIQTSDRNEKQDIEELSDAEKRVAVVAKGLMRKFRWKSKVAKKGDKARTHFGIIAQDLEDAFKAEGLDASKYAMFCSDTWWEKEITVDAVKADEEKGIEAKDAYTYIDTKEEETEGYTEKTRLGVRYSELLAFIISAI
jgi:hypothetical protein